MKETIKKSFIGGIVFLGTILTGFFSFAAYISLPTQGDGVTITQTIWNNVINKINDIGNNVDTLSTNISSLNSGFSSSQSDNGYQKLPNGLIIQWGHATTNISGYVDVTFSIPFTTAIYSRTATPFGNSGDSTIRSVQRDDINNVSLNGCRFTMRGNGNTNLNANFSYLIIGK